MIDEENSIDKGKLLDPDRFGYLSLHYVVSFLPSRLSLTEYRNFAEYKAEIQIRSILQHTWAEIEHDLGYKTKLAVPREVQRQFSRLAGLLELADDEFISIRNKLKQYEVNIAKVIDESPASALINKASLIEFIKSNKIANSLDRKIAAIDSSKVTYNESYFDDIPAELAYVGIHNMSDLNSLPARARIGDNEACSTCSQR